jgi:hypothetical protein
MNCQEFWNNPPQRGDNLGEEQTAHLAECGACAAQFEPHRALAKGLQSWVEEWRQLEAPPRVEAGLTAAFRSQTGFHVRRAVRHSWWTPVIAWASAAAAMIALAALLVRGYQPASPRPGTVAAPRHISQPVVEVATLPPADADSDDDSSVLGDGFVRLPNAPRIEPNEDFNVVRVEVPGSAMIAMGVPVSEDRAAETVLADVALGSDGTARAIRLIGDGGTF